jgi:hypothetical protein
MPIKAVSSMVSLLSHWKTWTQLLWLTVRPHSIRHSSRTLLLCKGSSQNRLRESKNWELIKDITIDNPPVNTTQDFSQFHRNEPSRIIPLKNEMYDQIIITIGSMFGPSITVGQNAISLGNIMFFSLEKHSPSIAVTLRSAKFT